MTTHFNIYKYNLLKTFRRFVECCLSGLEVALSHVSLVLSELHEGSEKLLQMKLKI